MENGTHQNHPGVGDQRHPVVCCASQNCLWVVQVAVDSTVLELLGNLVDEEVPVEEPEIAQHLVSGNGAPNVEADQGQPSQDLRGVQVEVCLGTRALEHLPRNLNKGDMVRRQYQVVHFLPAIKGLLLAPPVDFVCTSPAFVSALEVQGEEQPSVEEPPQRCMGQVEARAKRQEPQQNDVAQHQHGEDVGDPEELQVEEQCHLAAAEEAPVVVVEDGVPGLLLLGGLGNGAVGLLDVGVLCEGQEDHLAHMRRDGDVQHKVAVRDHRPAVVERVARGVHRVGKHGEDSVKDELVRVKQEEEVAPIPRVFPQHAVGV
eukprot:RCo005144